MWLSFSQELFYVHNKNDFCPFIRSVFGLINPLYRGIPSEGHFSEYCQEQSRFKVISKGNKITGMVCEKECDVYFWERSNHLCAFLNEDCHSHSLLNAYSVHMELQLLFTSWLSALAERLEGLRAAGFTQDHPHGMSREQMFPQSETHISKVQSTTLFSLF